jgi:hypothetical protein
VTTRPAAPALDVAVAAVTFKNVNAGRILVRMANGLNLQDIHNVQITTPANGEALVYEDGVWKNQTLSYAVEDLSDLSLSDVQVRQTLGYTGTGWTNITSGKILKVLSSVKSDASIISGFAIGLDAEFLDVSGLTLNITPESVDSKIFITVTGIFSTSPSDEQAFFNLVRNNVEIGQSSGASTLNSTAFYRSALNSTTPFSISFLDSPATTTTLTYKIQAATRSPSGTLYINRASANNDYRGISTISAMEVRF